MTRFDQASLATHFRDLNLAGRLLLPNAWDAASARIFEEAGFPAIGTTSAGIAYARGLGDGQRIGREAMVREIASVVAACERPITADIEAGYGPAPADVAETIDAVLDVGAVGVNLEDNTAGMGEAPLFSVADQARRIAAARSAAEQRGIPLVINARTDTFLLGLGADLDERIAMTVVRGQAYLEAGADLVFVPLLVDPDGVRRLVDAIDGPISLMALPGAPAAEVLFAAGARRVSLGQMAMLATLGTLRDIAKELRDTGTWTSIERSFYGFGEAEALFARRT
ncbi:MAG: isocitrate lyase/phosphoenolpyruvate mutase family protein [Luteitalea sp.]|nr:isocitrate lyase/phosphoenolpyruvate mutase family protein [Luteitalea sp.]